MKPVVTHDVRAVPGVNQDLVVGVCLPLHLLGTMRATTRGLWLTGGGGGAQTDMKMMQLLILCFESLPSELGLLSSTEKYIQKYYAI